MSERGVFAVDRGVFDHPTFAREPYTEREAWLWMIGAAAWKPMRVRVGRSAHSLTRGQLAFSERFLAVKWQWSKSRVHRFLVRLKIEAMVDLSADREVNRITICNYEKYAFNGTTRGPKVEPQTGPLADHSRTKEEERKNLKKGNAPSAPLFDQTDEAELFSRGKKVLGNGAGGLIVSLLKSKKGNVALARAAIEQASTKQKPSEYIGAILRGPADVRHTAKDPVEGIV